MYIVYLCRLYLAAAGLTLKMFREKFNRQDPIVAWRSGQLQQRGVFPCGAKYQFHGYGYSVEANGKSIEVEFYSPTEIGIDAWRLHAFMTQYPEHRALTLPQIEGMLASGLQSGELEKAIGAELFSKKLVIISKKANQGDGIEALAS